MKPTLRCELKDLIHPLLYFIKKESHLNSPGFEYLSGKSVILLKPIDYG